MGGDMPAKPQTMDDARVLRLFRDLFAATLDEVEGTGISRSTWVRIESGEERIHRPGVQRRLDLIRALLEIAGQRPYLETRVWMHRALRGVNRTPRELALSPSGLGYLVSRLRSQDEQTAT
ncbi:MAG TPA: hypothetical protein VGR25_13340 [bacterium]|jgi:hypothetical protein|nr:hypothetical protein [bacterium]